LDVSGIVQKEFPMMIDVNSKVLKERQDDLFESIKLLHSKITMSSTQQRILQQFPMTEDNVDKLIQIVHFIKISKKVRR